MKRFNLTIATFFRWNNGILSTISNVIHSSGINTRLKKDAWQISASCTHTIHPPTYTTNR